MMALVRMPKKDWYDILGAKPSDCLTELKRKYQKLVLLYHPDKQSADVPAGEVEERVQRFIEIDQAWKILGNEETKKEYDLQRRDEQCYTFLCRCGGKYTISKNETEEVSLVCCDTCSLIIEILR
ncbi:PREDICTED: dnaJ homolog subfamily C member 24 isoform X2 [Gavialis gangeticus]|uniref:dnaJ homolog subfamily C member 24 isoform X2 n=1 Tax=Gavialis gangeticus TaxID=94835 RepID=UPI00092EC160|nr:PREDICTED: dnaJ homolog subfamily C member 24 isoform X2 [Gavialis gangeticus]